MQAPKEKVSDMASAAKECIVHHKAKVEEKVIYITLYSCIITCVYFIFFQ